MHTCFGDNWKLLHAARLKLQSNFFAENNLAKNNTSKNYFYNFFRTTFSPDQNCYAHLFWGLLEAAAGRQSEAPE